MGRPRFKAIAICLASLALALPSAAAALLISSEGGGATFTVVINGPGSVEIPGWGTCFPPSCEVELPTGTKATLTANPDPDAIFLSWKGCDTAAGSQCTTTGGGKTITATFLGTPDLTVSKAPGSGLGKVTSYPGGILCLANCSTTTASFKEGAKVKLTPAPAKHFHFVEWLGDCTDAGACEVTMGEDHEVEALFAEDPKFGLSLTKEGDGQGTVKSLPVGINCGPTCSSAVASFYEGEVVELTATPGKGSNFEGWSGGGCSGIGTCKVTMSAARSVNAKFGPPVELILLPPPEPCEECVVIQ